LPDGTAVWLNAATSLRYPTRFAGKERRVLLTGEAYFEVTKNPGKPFIVDMPDHRTARQDTLHVQVLGTNFNINGYEDESTIKTTLIEGTVKIIQGQNARLLSPGQQAQTDNNGGLKIIRDADTEEALAWKNGLFQYNSTDLKAIMRQIARWYDVRIVYEGNLKDETFSGSVPRMEKVSQLLHMLAMTNTVHFTIEGKEIYVKP
jgi:ferric-dicitrate binding protein FerR (iron transport regulator)